MLGVSEMITASQDLFMNADFMVIFYNMPEDRIFYFIYPMSEAYRNYNFVKQTVDLRNVYITTIFSAFNYPISILEDMVDEAVEKFLNPEYESVTQINKLKAELTHIKAIMSVMADEVEELRNKLDPSNFKIVPIIKEIIVPANGNLAINYTENIDLNEKHISCYVKDIISTSRSNDKWINSEGVGSISIVTDKQLVVYNDYTMALPFRIVVY